jgi:methylated-DNA-protein-cysteine methyltransferase-like protein
MTAESRSFCINAAMSPFYEQVYNIVRQVPYGKVISYGQIARLSGRPHAARVVGWAMSRCPEHLPWQRVVMADGSVTGGVFADMRRSILESEGVTFLPDGRVDMSACQWFG